MMSSGVVLEATGISKSFPGVEALRDVDFQLRRGEVHAILGENGAGKSTLIKIMGGIHHADAGDIVINGVKANIDSARTASRLGISVIHQELVLVPHMSVAENIFLGSEIRTRLGLRNVAVMNRRAQEMAAAFGLNLDVATHVDKLTIAQRQMVEIVKAISFNARILVMDEPTSSLTEREVDQLFATIAKLKADGVGIIYISHRLSELFTVADRVTVMRDGRYIGTRNIEEVGKDELISMMVGREMREYYTHTRTEPGTTALEVRGLCQKGVFSDVSFHVKRGEIVGFAGLAGSGRTEILQAIFGLPAPDAGVVMLDGEAVAINNPRTAIAKKLALVPEDRKKQGLVLNNTLEFNLTLTVLQRFMRFLRIDWNKKKRIVSTYMDDLHIKAASPRQRTMDLSGGNQQKAVIGKWLASEPSILILDEPTRGVDVGAKAEIYSIMDALAGRGMAIVMISSELPEIVNMSDRVYVVHNGRIAAELKQGEITQENIMCFATGGI